MQEVKGTDINEIKKPEPEEYKNIKPENGITGKECRGFWENEFKKEAEYYNDYVPTSKYKIKVPFIKKKTDEFDVYGVYK